MEKKLESVLRDFEYHAREAVNAIQDRAAAQKLSKDAERRIAKLRREFREQFDSTVVAHSTGADQGDPHAQPQVVKHVAEGDTVKLKSTGRPARVVRKIDDNHFEVEMGAMKMKIARDDIAEVLASRPRRRHSRESRALPRNFRLAGKRRRRTSPPKSTSSAKPSTTPSREVEKFVDRAFLAGLPRVRVVHGSGMGILRKALRQMLQQHPHVASVAEAPAKRRRRRRNAGGVAYLANRKSVKCRVSSATQYESGRPAAPRYSIAVMHLPVNPPVLPMLAKRVDEVARRGDMDLRAEMGRLSRAGLPRRRRDPDPEPRRKAAEPLLPRIVRSAARAVARALRARWRNRHREPRAASTSTRCSCASIPPRRA